MFEEWSATLTLTEESSKELFRVLQEQDEAFINDVLDGKCGFTLESADGRRVELVPKADRKTEPTISKMEQVDKDINVRSKTEQQTDIHGLTDCDFCKDRNCEDCEGGNDEPQTDCSWR